MSDRHKEAAYKRGVIKMAKTLELVKDAMAKVEDEMKLNAGIYPRNGGAISIAEISRRAGINEATLYKKINTELKDKVLMWLTTLKMTQTVGRKRVRQNFQERALGWKERHDALQSRHILTELHLQKSLADYEILREKYEALLKQLHSVKLSNVVPFKTPS